MRKILFAAAILLSLQTVYASDKEIEICGENNIPCMTMEGALKAAGITERMIESQADSMAILNDIEPSLQKAIPEYFAGSWLQDDGTGKFIPVIAVKGDLQTSKSLNAIYKNAKIIPVKYSLKELEDVNDLVDKEFFTNNSDLGFISTGLDYILNKVVITVTPGSEDSLKFFLDFHGIDKGKYSIIVRDVIITPTALVLPGSGIFLRKGNGTHRYCTNGYVGSVTGIPEYNGVQVLITAGHCFENGVSNEVKVMKQEPSIFFSPSMAATNIGATIGSQIHNELYTSRREDVAFYVNAGTIHTLAPIVNTVGYSTHPPITNTAPINATLCGYGIISGWRCGIVLAVNQITKQGTSEEIRGLTLTTLCGRNGDSGGPVMIQNGPKYDAYSVMNSIMIPNPFTIGGNSAYSDNSNCLYATSNGTSEYPSYVAPIFNYLSRQKLSLMSP